MSSPLSELRPLTPASDDSVLESDGGEDNSSAVDVESLGPEGELGELENDGEQEGHREGDGKMEDYRDRGAVEPAKSRPPESHPLSSYGDRKPETSKLLYLTMNYNT